MSLSYVASAQVTPAPTPPTPIIIDLGVASGKTVITLNNQAMTVDGIGVWLARVQKDFGGDDPVAIRFGSDTTIGLLLELRQVAMRTHHEVHLIFDERREGSKPKELSVSDSTPKWLDAPIIVVPMPQPQQRTWPNEGLRDLGDFMTPLEQSRRAH